MPKFLEKLKEGAKRKAFDASARMMANDMKKVEKIFSRTRRNENKKKDANELTRRFFTRMKKIPKKDRNKYTLSIMAYWPEFINNVKKRRIGKKDLVFLSEELEPYYESCMDCLLEKSMDWLEKKRSEKK